MIVFFSSGEWCEEDIVQVVIRIRGGLASILSSGSVITWESLFLSTSLLAKLHIELPFWKCFLSISLRCCDDNSLYLRRVLLEIQYISHMNIVHISIS